MNKLDRELDRLLDLESIQDHAAEKCFGNATHYLICRNPRNGKFFKMRCHVLKCMPDGQVQVQVYGKGNLKNTTKIVRVRSVSITRIKKIL